MPAEPESSAGRSGAGREVRRPAEARLSREIIVNAALTFLDREGWDALTINALATQLGNQRPVVVQPRRQPGGPAPHGPDPGHRRHHH